jgi:hypothetical protein
MVRRTQAPALRIARCSILASLYSLAARCLRTAAVAAAVQSSQRQPSLRYV